MTGALRPRERHPNDSGGVPYAFTGLGPTRTQDERRTLAQATPAVLPLHEVGREAPALPTPLPASASRPEGLLVHTPGLSRHVSDTTEEFPEKPLVHPARAAWLAAVERETEAHREKRAQGYEQKAKRKRRQLQRQGLGERDVARGILWWTSRAKGQRERFENERQCQQAETLHIVCSCCGKAQERKKCCGVSSICDACRGRTLAKRRAQFARSRQHVLREARFRGWRNPKRLGGAYSEKMLVLTLPHLLEHDVATRITFVRNAVPHFLKSLNGYLRNIGEHLEFFRSHEWTMGDDEQGHPHVPWWFFGPYVPHVLLVEWWSEALRRAGFPAEHLDKLVVHIERVRNGKVRDRDGIITELVKYMCKDVIAPGKFVSPATRARVYEAYDQARIAQASKGFLKRGEEPVRCSDCDAVGMFVARVGNGPWRGSIEAKRPFTERSQGPPKCGETEPFEVTKARWDARARDLVSARGP